MTSSPKTDLDDPRVLNQRLEEAKCFNNHGLDSAEKQLLFLYVARHSGTSLIEIQNDLGFPRSSVSRVMIALGTRRKGLGLVQAQRSAISWRELEVSLTPKGRLVLKELAEISSAKG